MDRIFVCTLMLLILFPEMILAQKIFKPLSPASGQATIAEFQANDDRFEMLRKRASIADAQDDYLDLLLTLTPTEYGLFNKDAYLGIGDKNKETDVGKSLYPELIADASDGDSNIDADGNDNTDSDDDADSDDDSDKGNDALTPAER